MAIKAMEPITEELLADGLDPNTPVAVIYNAGARDQEIIRTTLAHLPHHGRESCTNKPGLILIGENSTYEYSLHTVPSRKTHPTYLLRSPSTTCSQPRTRLWRHTNCLPLIQLTPARLLS